jgi:hypothetical protein
MVEEPVGLDQKNLHIGFVSFLLAVGWLEKCFGGSYLGAMENLTR